MAAPERVGSNAHPVKMMAVVWPSAASETVVTPRRARASMAAAPIGTSATSVGTSNTNCPIESERYGRDGRGSSGSSLILMREQRSQLDSVTSPELGQDMRNVALDGFAR